MALYVVSVAFLQHQ